MPDTSVPELLTPDSLVRSLSLVQSLIDHLPLMVWVGTADGVWQFTNRAWLSFRGRTHAHEVGSGWTEGIHADDRDKVVQQYLDACRNLAPFTMEHRLLRADGTYRWVSNQGLAWFTSDGRFGGHIGSCVETANRTPPPSPGIDEGTPPRPHEAEDQLRQLAARLQRAREDERAQLARELHDELGQTLTALKLDINRTVNALLEQRLTPGIIDRVQSLVGLTEIALATVKRLATKLRPPTLDHLGLAEAMHWEALTFKARTGLRCQVRANKARTSLSGEQQTALFRIFQEALTNIVRHAQASAVGVTLTERNGQFEMRIRDNGRGITEIEAADPRAIGLLGMRERAALVGGTLHIAGRRGRGTTLTVHVPVSRPPIRPSRAATRKKGLRTT